MKLTTILFLVLFIGLPALWYVPAMIWGFQISKATSAVQSSTADTTSAFDTLIGGPAPMRWLQDRKEIHRYYSTDTLTKGRRVSLELRMPFTDLLAPGEDMPDPDLHDLYAKARAATTLIQYCPEVLGTLATKCDVLSTSVRQDRDGQVRISGTLAVLPAYEIGDLGAVENAEVLTATASLVDRKDKHPFEADARAQAMEDALQFCTLVRTKFGNCLISNLNLHQTKSRARDDEATYLDASVQVAVLTDNTLYRADSFREEIQRIQDVLTN